MDFSQNFEADVQATSNLAWSNSASNAAGPDGGQQNLVGKVLTIDAGVDAIGLRTYNDTSDAEHPVKKRTLCYIAKDASGNTYKVSPSFLFSPAIVKAGYTGQPSYADLKPRTLCGKGIQGQRVTKMYGDTEVSAYIFNSPVTLEYFEIPAGSIQTVKSWSGVRGSKRATLNTANTKPYIVAALGTFDAKAKPTKASILSKLLGLIWLALPTFFLKKLKIF